MRLDGTPPDLHGSCLILASFYRSSLITSPKLLDRSAWPLYSTEGWLRCCCYKLQADLLSITSSPIFTFVVGPDHKEHTIHSALVAHQSKALNALINGQAKEAINRIVVWDETDEETFIRFSQFVYTGSYDEAEFQERKVDEAIPNHELSDLDSVNELQAQPVIKRKPKKSLETADLESKRAQLWYTFTTLYAPPSFKSQCYVNGPNDDYSNVFLCHARIYVFADYHGIDDLQTLSLLNLRRALTRFVLHADGCGDIIQLVQYCYENTIEKGSPGDALQSLICFYAACKMEDLWKDAVFQDLTISLPEFSRGLFSVLMNRLG